METNLIKLASASELLKQALKLVKSKAKIVYTLAILVYIVPVLLVVGSFGIGKMQERIPDGLGFVLIAVVLIIGILAAIFNIWVEVAVLWALINPVSTREALGQTWGKMRGYLRIVLLTLLIVLPGIILLIIPGIIFSIWYTFALPVFLVEGLTGMDALRKSKSYVAGRFGAVCWRLFFVMLVYVVLNIIGVFFPDQIKTVYSGALNFLLAPVFLAYHYVLYQNLRVTSVPVAPQPQAPTDQ